MRKWVILGYDTVVPNVANIDADTPRYPVTVLKKPVAAAVVDAWEWEETDGKQERSQR